MRAPHGACSSVAWLLWGALSCSAVIEQWERERVREALRAACESQQLHPCSNQGPPMMPHRLKQRIVGNLLSYLELIGHHLSFKCSKIHLYCDWLQQYVWIVPPAAWGTYSVFFQTCRINLIKFWLMSETGKVLISTSFPQNTWQPKGIHSFSAKTKKLPGLKLLEAGQKLSLRQILLHFILWKWDFILSSYPLSCGCWLSLILRCTPDSSNCNFALLPTSDALTSGHSQQLSFCSTPFSFLLYDTFNIALIYMFSVIPPCGAAHDNDHVAKWAAAPVPTSRVGTGARWLASWQGEEAAGSITVIKYVCGCVGG